MKRILLYILLILTVLLAAACDAFFLPPFERTNPNDSNAPVAPVASFQATPTDGATIELTWTLPEDRAPSLLLIVRNDVDQPTNVDDGTIITPDSGSLVPAADGLFTDTQEVSEDTSYWYGVWSAHGDADASLEDYVFVGPVYDSASTTLQTKVIYPALDGYVSDIPDSDFTSPYLYTSYDNMGPDTYNTLMLFDLSDFTKPIFSADFFIYCEILDSTDTLYIDPILTSWDTSATYADTVAAGFADGGENNYMLSIPGSGPYTVAIAPLVNSWIVDGNNYGILLSATNDPAFMESTQFQSSEGVQKPSLTILYYE